MTEPSVRTNTGTSPLGEAVNISLGMFVMTMSRNMTGCLASNKPILARMA